MRKPIGIGIVGVGKIARDQHLPALAANSAYSLLAAVSRQPMPAGTPVFASLEDMIAATPTMCAVSLCTPPSVRSALARTALAAGLHVMLEKPPGQSVSEVADLERRALQKGVSLFASWHSREAAGVETARLWLAARRIERVDIAWHEDVRVWHPGQLWLWQPGGLGVFDPGINALSIATRILPEPLIVESAMLDFPINRETPIAAELRLLHGAAPCVAASFNFRHSGAERWDIDIQTDMGRLLLSRGGAELRLNGEPLPTVADAEYPALYRRFARLIAAGACDVDLRPLQLVADAFLCGSRRLVAAFDP